MYVGKVHLLWKKGLSLFLLLNWRLLGPKPDVGLLRLHVASVFSIVYFCDPLIQSLSPSKPYPFLNPSQILFSKAKSFSKGLGCSKEAIKVIGFQPSNTQMPRGLGGTGPVGLSSHCFFNVVSVKDGGGGNRRMEERQSGEENVEARKSSKQGAVVCHW